MFDLISLNKIGQIIAWGFRGQSGEFQWVGKEKLNASPTSWIDSYRNEFYGPPELKAQAPTIEAYAM